MEAPIWGDVEGERVLGWLFRRQESRRLKALRPLVGVSHRFEVVLGAGVWIHPEELLRVLTVNDPEPTAYEVHEREQSESSRSWTIHLSQHRIRVSQSAAPTMGAPQKVIIHYLNEYSQDLTAQLDACLRVALGCAHFGGEQIVSRCSSGVVSAQTLADVFQRSLSPVATYQQDLLPLILTVGRSHLSHGAGTVVRSRGATSLGWPELSLPALDGRFRGNEEEILRQVLRGLWSEGRGAMAGEVFMIAEELCLVPREAKSWECGPGAADGCLVLEPDHVYSP